MSNSRSAGTVFEGNLDAKGLKFGIVCARFNDFFVSRLLDGAMDAIVRHGGSAADVERRCRWDAWFSPVALVAGQDSIVK